MVPMKVATACEAPVVGRRHRRRVDDRRHRDDVRRELPGPRAPRRRPGSAGVRMRCRCRRCRRGGAARRPAGHAELRRRSRRPRRDRPLPPPVRPPAPVERRDGERVAAEADRLLDGGARPVPAGDQDDHRRDADDDPRASSAASAACSPARPRTANRALSQHVHARRRRAARRRGGGPSGPATRDVGTARRPSRMPHHPLRVLGDLLLVGDHDQGAPRGVQVGRTARARSRGAGAVQRCRWARRPAAAPGR